MPKMQPDVFSSPVIKRYNGGKPVLSKEDIPYPADLVFNAGVAKFGGNYVRLERPMPVYSRGGKDRLIYGFPNRPICGFGENPVF